MDNDVGFPSPISIGWRRLVSLGLAAAAVGAAFGLFTWIGGLTGTVLTFLAVGVGGVLARRVVWSQARWERHVLSRRRASAGLLNANAGLPWHARGF